MFSRGRCFFLVPFLLASLFSLGAQGFPSSFPPASPPEINLMHSLILPDMESHRLDKNTLTPHEKILMAHLLSMEALILSMQALESEGKLLPASHMPKSNSQYLSLEREISGRNLSTINAKILRQDITRLTQLYTSLQVFPRSFSHSPPSDASKNPRKQFTPTSRSDLQRRNLNP